ncbi:MAG: YidC/Oxa1 family membrane protein insertase [Anaerolineae bacterium]
MWDSLIINPMINAMLLFYSLLGHQFILAIIALTVLIRIIVFPLSLRQQRSMVMMQGLQQSKEWQDIQKKYKNDREKLSQEQMRMYRERGLNPMGGCLPLFIQFPILIGLYQSVIRVLATSPLQLIDLAPRVYVSGLAALVPLNDRFFWLDLGRSDPLYILPILVVISSWLQQKLLTPPNPDPQAASMNQSMQYTMPLIMGVFALQFSSAVAIYFIISNLVGIAQYAAINRWFRGRWETEAQVIKKQSSAPAKPQPVVAKASDSGADRRVIPAKRAAPKKKRKKKRVKKKK